MNIQALSSNAPLSKPNKFKLSGNEEQTDFDLNVYDFNARTYDPVIGRFMQIDPMADKRVWINPYNYVQNNPLIRVDPLGTKDDYYAIIDEELVYLGNDGEGDGVRLVNRNRVEEAQANINGSSTTEEQRQALRSNEFSKEIKFNEEGIQAAIQGASDRTLGGLENSAMIVLNVKSATVDAVAGPEGNSEGVNFDKVSLQYGSDGLWTYDDDLILGYVHGHPKAGKGSRNLIGFSKDDAESAGNASAAAFSIDSYLTSVGGDATIHQIIPGDKAGTNPVATTRSSGGLGRIALQYTAKKK